MILINSVSSITSHLNMIVSELEKSTISLSSKIDSNFNHALECGYVEEKAINIQLIQFYKEVIYGIKYLSYEQCKDSLL